MLYIQRERMRTYLSRNTVAVLTVPGTEGVSAMPVRYRAENLELDCLVPRWSDIAYNLESHQVVLMVVLIELSSSEDQLCWLQYKGVAHPEASPNWAHLLPKGVSQAIAGDMYLVLHVVPERIDLLDESRGWGVRETLEIEDNT